MSVLTDWRSEFRFQRIMLVLLALAVALLPRSAYANAPAPPSDLRFEFVYETSEPVTLEGAQLLACEGDCTATESMLAAGYGQCGERPCIDLTATYEVQPLEMVCSQEACEYDGGDRYYYGYKLLLYFSDGMRESREFNATAIPYQVRVQDDGVVVRSLSSDGYLFVFAVLGFVPALLVTWLIESAVVWLFLTVRKLPRRNILLWMLPMHLATIPMVWSFFPAMSWAPIIEARTFAPAALGLVVLMAVLAVLFRQGRLGGRGGVGAVVLVVVGVPALMFLGSRGILTPPLLDMSPTVTTALSELFIFTFEAWFLSTVSRGRLPLAQAAVVSLLANLTSYGLGFLVTSV